MQKMLSWVALGLLIQATLTYGNYISVSNGGPWGSWGVLQKCTLGTAARAFSLKVERGLGASGDDTSVNSIMLYCAPPESTATKERLTSLEGGWGEWTSVQWCPRGNLTSFALKVEKPQGGGDDTAANNIMMQCTDHTILTGVGNSWGDYASWSGVCSKGICGIQTRVEPKQGGGDDTALNDVQFECC